MKTYSESSSSSSSSSILVKKRYSVDLHDFKMNLMNTLNSEYMTKFNDNKLKRFKKNTNIPPRIPVKVIPANYYYSINNRQNQSNDGSNDDDELEEDLFIKSKLNSPFMFRKSITSIDFSYVDLEILKEDSATSDNSSSIISQTDSGLSSADSTQLFISDLKECLSSFKTSNNNNNNNKLITDECSLMMIQFMSKVGNGSLLKNLVKKYPDKWFYQVEKSKKMQQQQQQQHQIPLDKSNFETLELLLQLKREENISITEIADQDGNSLIHKAIIYNQYEVVRYLLVNYTSLLGIRNCFGFYPIHLCVVKGNMQMLRLICRESKKFLNKRDNSGLTPAMHAAIEGKYETLKYLLDNANAKYTKLTKKDKYTLLHLAVQSGSIDSVQYLLMKMGMSYLKLRTKDSATCYHLAAARGHDQILEYLLANKSSKYIKYYKDITGSSPAHDAAENGHYKCLKLLYDSGLDMFEQDAEHITPYDLAMASKNPDCRNFAINLKPTLSFEDGPIQINSVILQQNDSNNLQYNHNSSDTSIINNTNNAATTGNKKINLRKISSMLRLRRAKDISQNEPAYLYTQRFRPAPVSLPQSSQITGFKSGAPSILNENEDDFNDSAIDEIINQVNNSSKKVEHIDDSKVQNKLILKKKEIKSPSLNAAISKRISRYQQHCQQELNSKNITTLNENIFNKLKSSISPKSSQQPAAAAPPPPILDTSSILNTKHKSSVSSSHNDSVPTLIKLSKSETNNKIIMDKYSSLNNKNKVIVKLDTLSKSNKPVNSNNAHKSPSLNSNFKLASKMVSNNNNNNNNKDSRDQRKTVAFEDTPPVVIEASNNTIHNQDDLDNTSNDTLTQDKLKIISNNKLKRTSLTKLIGNSQPLLTNKISLTISANNNNTTIKTDEYDKLSHQVNIDNSQKYQEPEPDYWDVPSESTNNDETNKNTKEKQLAKTNSNSKVAAISLAEILVKSISSTSTNSNKSDSLSSSLSSSSVDGEFKKKLKTNTTNKNKEETVESESKSIDLIAKKFASLNEMGILAKSSLNKRYLDSFKEPDNQVNNKSETSSLSTNTPSLPAIDYDNDDNINNNTENEKNNESINETISISSNQKLNDEIYSSLNEDLNNNNNNNFTTTTAVTTTPPPPPPPPPFMSPNSDTTTKTLITSISNESLMQAKQKLKIQSTNLAESNELTITSSSIPSCSSSLSSNSSIENIKSSSLSSNNNNNLTSSTKKNDFFLKEIQNHRLYNTKKDYVLDFLDRNSNTGSKHTYTTPNANAAASNSKNNDSDENENNNNKSCIIVVNNNNNKQQMNRTLSNVNLTKQTDNTSLQDESSFVNNYSLLSKSESFDSNHQDEPQSTAPTTSPVSVVQEQKPKVTSNYERFPYIRNRQITPQPNSRYMNNYVNYYNITNLKQHQRAKSNDATRVASSTATTTIMAKNEPVENQIQKNLKSVSADHLNQSDNTTIDKQDLKLNNNSSSKIATILINYEPNKSLRSHQSLSSLNSSSNQDKSITTGSTILSTSTTTNNNNGDDDETIQTVHKPKVIKEFNASNLNLTKKFRQLQPPEKTESELDRVFKKRALLNLN